MPRLPTPTREEQRRFRRVREVLARLPNDAQAASEWFTSCYSITVLDRRRRERLEELGGYIPPEEGVEVHKTNPENEVFRGLSVAVQDQLSEPDPWDSPRHVRRVWAIRVLFIAAAMTNPDAEFDGALLGAGFGRNGAEELRLPRSGLWKSLAMTERGRQKWNGLLVTALDTLDDVAVSSGASKATPSGERLVIQGERPSVRRAWECWEASAVAWPNLIDGVQAQVTEDVYDRIHDAGGPDGFDGYSDEDGKWQGPEFLTFRRYVNAAKQARGISRNAPRRARRASGRSIVGQDGADPDLA